MTQKEYDIQATRLARFSTLSRIIGLIEAISKSELSASIRIRTAYGEFNFSIAELNNVAFLTAEAIKRWKDAISEMRDSL